MNNEDLVRGNEIKDEQRKLTSLMGTLAALTSEATLEVTISTPQNTATRISIPASDTDGRARFNDYINNEVYVANTRYAELQAEFDALGDGNQG